MKISDFISIDSVYTRSINIERDADSSAIIEAYIPTTRSISTLQRFMDTLNEENVPRSWALIGPYGAGKSAFAVYLANLLKESSVNKSKKSFDSIESCDQKLKNELTSFLKRRKGFASVLITGAPEPMIPRFLASLKKAAEDYWKNKPGRNPKIVGSIEDAISSKNFSVNNILQLVESFRVAVEKEGGGGLLFVFDELGKFLEYEARHYGTNDIYLLQSLAEQAVSGHEANIFLFTLMHQGFEQYARGLGEELRNEWSKIQGRFENIPFIESSEQTIRVFSKAFVNNLSSENKKKIENSCLTISKILEKEKALPKPLDAETATNLFVNCYPLHPIAVLLLPTICHKMAQNERTLFSYLGSKEQHGFIESLSKLESISDWVMPWQIYDYFILNQPAVLTDPTTHRRWAEVVSAIERLGDVPASQVNMLKTIGLINIVGPQGGFKASNSIIGLCSSNPETVVDTTSKLKEASVLQFRKFSNEFRVWQGSDFDLDKAVQEELDQIGRFSLPEELNESRPLQPIVAHRHTIETGSLRYFTPLFIDCDSYTRESSKTRNQRIIFYLAETADDLKIGYDDVTSSFSNSDLIAIVQNGARLREAIGEVLALRRVEQNRPELQSDPVAKHEFKDRMNAAEYTADGLISHLVAQPQEAKWFWKTKEVKIGTKRDFQKHLSKILDETYIHTPHIHNELINREKPSAQAIAARNKLVEAMVNNEEHEDLRIDKFPAEKGIYRAFLRATGLHKQTSENKWKLVSPDKNNPYNLYPVWKRIDQFLRSTQDKPKSFSNLDEILQAPPYGVKSGVLPLLYLTVFLCNQSEVALFEDNVYIPYITEQHIDRFMKRPDFFGVQLLRLHGIRASLFQQYVKVLYGEDTKKDFSLISIVRPLAKFVADLEDFTKQTNRLSDASKKTLKAFDSANSPADLLFTKLPSACGYTAINPDDTDDEKIDEFASTLVAVIQELREAYSNMVEEFTKQIKVTLLPDNNGEISLKRFRNTVKAKYEDLLQYTADVKGLRMLIEILSDEKANDSVWLNRILLFLGSKAPTKWTDINRDGAIKKLNELSNKLIDLRLLQDHHIKMKRSFGEGYEVIRVRSLRHGKEELDHYAKIDRATKEYIDKSKNDFYNLLNNFDTDDSKLAILAELYEEVLEEKKNKKEEGQQTSIKVANG